MMHYDERVLAKRLILRGKALIQEITAFKVGAGHWHLLN